jgi:hypothetical protein
VSLVRPRAKVTLDGQQLTSAEAAVLRVRLSLSVLGSHDAAELVLWPRSKFAGAKIGGTLAIALGDQDAEVDVWTGEVTAVETGPDAVVVEGLASTIELSRRRLSQTYLDQSIADIVRDLAGPVTVDEADSDVQLSSYAVDDRRPVWSYLGDLARIAGAELGASASGGLRFVPVPTGAAELRLRAGADVVSSRIGPRPQPIAPTVAAHGAGSEAGGEQWHWLLRAPSPSDGDGPVDVVAALHTRDAASAMGRALTDRAARAATTGRVHLVGRAGVRPGALVEITELPTGSPGVLHVLAVEHTLDSRAGFITQLSVEGAT